MGYKKLITNKKEFMYINIGIRGNICCVKYVETILKLQRWCVLQYE